MRDHIYSNINEAAYTAMVERKQRKYRQQRTYKQLVEAWRRYQAKKKAARCGDTETAAGEKSLTTV